MWQYESAQQVRRELVSLKHQLTLCLLIKSSLTNAENIFSLDTPALQNNENTDVFFFF